MWNSWFWFLDFQRNHFRDSLSYLPTCMWVGIFQSLAVWILNFFRYLQKLHIDIEIHWELKEPCLLVIFVQLHMRFIPGLVQRTFWLDWDNPRQLVNIVTDRRQACILKTLVRLWPVQHLTLYLTRSSLNHSLLLISTTPDSLIFLLFVLFFLATFLGHPSFHNLLVYLGAVIHSVLKMLITTSTLISPTAISLAQTVSWPIHLNIQLPTQHLHMDGPWGSPTHVQNESHHLPSKPDPLLWVPCLHKWLHYPLSCLSQKIE